MDCTPIVLAHEHPFRIGSAEFFPATREVKLTGQSSIVEPRVMQMLVALRRAGGSVVTKDELTQMCWGGRVVGEDAINRVVSRLRSLAEKQAERQFRVETITRVGYRLVYAEGETPTAIESPLGGLQPSRRKIVLAAGGAIVGGLVATGLYLDRRREKGSDVPSDVAPLVAQAAQAMAQQNREGQNQAIGLYRRVIEIRPEYADGWGLLGIAYASTASYRPSSEAAVMRSRAQSAAGRALGLADQNSYGLVANALAQPLRGNWLEIERRLRSALSLVPNDRLLSAILSQQLGEVGRFNDALNALEGVTAGPLTPSLYFQWMLSLWGAGRVEELDRVIEEAGQLYPTQFAIWFLRFYIALFGGRPGAAIAMAEDREKRPSGIPTGEIDELVSIAQVARAPTATGIDTVMRQQSANARRASGKAENAIQFACLFGRIDDALALAEAYYFSRAFVVPEVRFSIEQGSYTSQENRLTRFLFLPSTKAMRADARFLNLTTELGLERYWRSARSGPDYRRT